MHKIKASVERILREEQAGFRGSKFMRTSHLFSDITFIEQSLEWNSPLYINFLDFEKAFDSVHNNTLWSIMPTTAAV